MTKKITFLITAALMLLTMMATTGTMWGQTKGEGDTHEFSQTLSQLLNNSATIAPINIAAQSYPIKKVTVHYRYNKTITDAVTIEVSVGGVSWGTQNSTGTGSNYTNAVFEGTPTTGAVAITFTNNTGSGTGHGTFWVDNVILTEGPSSGTPYISANDVNIAYNATEGSIAYTVNNPVTGGTLTASTTATWLTPGTVTNTTVPFTCEANPTAAARTATVTLTYTYNAKATVTKTVTVTQAGNPNVVNNISDITAAGNYVVQGTIVAMSARGFVVGDGTGYAYYYYGDNFTTTHVVGDIVKLSGAVSTYNHVYQIAAASSIEDAENSNYNNTPAIQVLDATAIGTYSTGNHLSDYVQFEGTLVKSGNYYNVQVSDLSTDASISFPTTTQASALDALINKTVTVKGYFAGVSGGHFGVMLENIEETTITTPSITANNVNIAYYATQGSISYTIENAVTGGALEATTTSEWITLPETFASPISFTCTANTGGTARSATVTLTYTYNAKATVTKNVTVTQAAAPTYAELPFSFNGGRADIENIDGLSQEGLGTDYNASTNPTTKLKFDSTGDWVLLQFNERPGTLTFNIKGNSFSGSTFKVQISEDGITYTDLETYTELGDTQDESFNNLGENVRYIKWIYTEKSSGNVGLGNIALATYVAPQPSITAADVEITYDATGGSIAYTINNVVSGGTLTASTEADWISDFKYDQADEIGEVEFTTTANDGAARQAIVTLTYTYNTNQTVTKDVTISQAALPMPTITVDPATVNAPAAGETSNLALTYQDITIAGANDFGIQYYDANNEPLSSDPDWLLVVVESSQTSGYVVSYTIDENTGNARTAYFKVFAMNGEEFVYSNHVTINQAAYVPPVQIENYELFSGDLVEGDYLIVYNGVAMNNTVDSDRLQYEDVTPENNVISTNDATIVWHIAPSATSGYWTIYSANANAYAASTGAKNKAQMLADGTDDKALWSVESTAQSETYDFVNKQNTTNEVNATLRCNGTYGFACYANSTGGALSLYKKAIPSITINPGPYNMNCDGGHAVLDVAYANMAQDPQLEVIFYESDGTTDATYNHDWIDAHIDNDGNLDGTIQLNTSNEARSAYFKIKGVGNNSELVYSDLVTINQAAYALSIVFETTELNIEVGGESDRKISFDYSGLGSDPSFEVRRYESDGTTPATYDWLTTTISGNKVKITVPANPGDARHAYFKVYGSGSIANTESNLVTINQAEYVAPTYTVTYNANGGIGTMTDPNSPYTENTQVTLLENTFTAPEGKIWDSWLVEDANQTPIEVNEGKFNMPASNVTVTAQWIDNPIVPTYEWVLTALEDITSSDVFVIVGNNGSNYAMTNDNGTTNAPATADVIVANNKLKYAPANNLKWNLEIGTNGYTFYPNGVTNKWLYCTDANNGLRVGTEDNKVFAYEEVTITDKEGYYLTITPASDKRYVCIYNNSDWRSYKSGSIVKTDTKFYKRQVASTDPQLSANDVNIASDATEGEITYTLENAVPGGQLSAEITAGNEGNWLTLGNVGETTVSFTCEDNTEQTERTATVTLTYTYNETSISATAVVTQAALIIDYATMPFAFDGGRADIENVNGLTQEGLDSDYGSSPKLKFNTTGDWMVLKLNAKPVSIIYDIKGNTFSGGTFNVQVSTDGITYNNIKEYTSLSDVQTDTLINANDDVRYIKWIYTAKSSGNVALGNIQVYDVEFTIINENTTIPDLTIANGEAYVVNSGVVLELTGTVTNTNPANLIVRDGGQLIHTNPDGVNATLQKVVEAYTPANRSGDGWYMIATPVDNLPKTAVASTSDFDLFLYNEPNAMWYAHWDNPGFETLYRGKGYLYANAADVDLNYAGLMKATDAEFSVPLSYECDDPDMKGFNLVGNPFTRNLKLGDMQLGGATLTQFYVVNSEHTGLVPIDNIDYEIKPGEGFFVQATEKNQTLEFNPSTKGLEDIRFIKIVAGNENCYDNAYINIGCGNTLRKTNIANLTSVYVMDQGMDYAAARVEELAGNMPVHFAPSEDGFFTITVEAKNIENINFMHLIDNIENTAINLLAEPTYTFKAGTSDNEDRFTLVFDFNNYLDVNENNLNDSFVYQSGDELILNGEGTLQVFDMMGRFVMSKEISGSERISTSTFETGVYVLRFVGETVMTQKIVIE